MTPQGSASMVWLLYKPKRGLGLIKFMIQDNINYANKNFDVVLTWQNIDQN